MAGEWMKVELSLPDKPEVHRMAGILSIDSDAVVGKLVRVWAWFDKHTEDGNAHGVTFALLDRITSVTGFAEAMQLVGWLEQRDMVLHMPKFDRHTSESSKKRALTAKRVSKKRNANSNANVTLAALPEKRREENILKPKTDDQPAADPVKQEIWEKGKAVLLAGGTSPEAARPFLGKLCKDFGQILVLQAIRDCVAATPAEPKAWLVARCQEKRKKEQGNGKFNVLQANKRGFQSAIARELDKGAASQVVDDLHGPIYPLLS